MSNPSYSKGNLGVPVINSGGVKRLGKGRFRKPAPGMLLVRRVPDVRESGIVLPDDTEADVASYVIVDKGSDHFVPGGTGAPLPFMFEPGAEIILCPRHQRRDGSWYQPTVILEPNGEVGADGKPMRMIVSMADVLAEIEPSEDRKGFDA